MTRLSGTGSVVLPFEALDPYVADSVIGGIGGSTEDGDTVAKLARNTGMSRSHLQHMRERGVPSYWADTIAIKGLGIHPSLVWTECWFESADLEPACRWCGSPARAQSPYCSPKHRRSQINEWDRDRKRLQRWYRRLERYAMGAPC